MLRIECPNCGPRNAAECRYGGEYKPRPTPAAGAAYGSSPERSPERSTDRSSAQAEAQAEEQEWIRYLYLRRNPMGVQLEWWYHRSGCGLWFLVERDRRSNVVLRTRRWQPGLARAAGSSGPATEAPPGAAGSPEGAPDDPGDATGSPEGSV